MHIYICIPTYALHYYDTCMHTSTHTDTTVEGIIPIMVCIYPGMGGILYIYIGEGTQYVCVHVCMS